MVYVLITLLLFAAMLVYFRIVDCYNIADKPNERNSHNSLAIRGGGIVFYLGALAWFIWYGGAYIYFFTGLTLITLISFFDDILPLSNKVRSSIHLLSVALLLLQVQLFEWPLWVIAVASVLIIGIINAYNFMDGIHGITAMYSFAVLLLLWLTNREFAFIDYHLLYCTAIANGIFAFFNFRKRAKCVAGGVGSVSMCFILLFATLDLIISTGSPVFILFFAVLGIDSLMTVIFRLLRGENIFKPHRTYLYRYLAQEGNGNPVLISICYGLAQLGIGLLCLAASKHLVAVQIGVIICVLALLVLAYIGLRHYVWAGKFSSHRNLVRRMR